jgi:hypothetical protein
MGLTNAGRDFIAGAIINDSSPTFFDNTNAYIGVGDGDTAFAVGQSDLQAATNKVRVGMEDTYPSITDNAIDFKAEFGTDAANWQWNEWGVFNDSSAGTMLNRKVENLGTKVAGSTWVLTVTLTVGIGS